MKEELVNRSKCLIGSLEVGGGFSLKQEAFQIPSPCSGCLRRLRLLHSFPPGRTAEGTLGLSGKKDPALTPRALRSDLLFKWISVILGLHRKAIWLASKSSDKQKTPVPWELELGSVVMIGMPAWESEGPGF